MDVITPVAFNLPNAGKLLLLVFIPFSAWFSGSPLSAASYPMFPLTGLFTFFGSTSVAIPYLLDIHKLPQGLV